MIKLLRSARQVDHICVSTLGLPFSRFKREFVLLRFALSRLIDIDSQDCKVPQYNSSIRLPFLNCLQRNTCPDTDRCIRTRMPAPDSKPAAVNLASMFQHSAVAHSQKFCINVLHAKAVCCFRDACMRMLAFHHSKNSASYCAWECRYLAIHSTLQIFPQMYLFRSGGAKSWRSLALTPNHYAHRHSHKACKRCV